MVWMTTAEALDVLNVRPQTLYANVSRGKIRAKPDEDDPRRSLYHRDDVLRMARRANGRRKVEIVSSEAMQYGDPVLATLVTAMAGDDADLEAASPRISCRLARSWRAEAHEDLIRRVLVLMADNELNASTFATRVAISTGASLAAGVLAGFTTLTGPLHGGAAREFAQLIAQAHAGNATDAVRQWLASGRPLPAFGHPLYSGGDPRARALLQHLPAMQPYGELAAAAEQQAGELPNIDYALSLLSAHCGLPPDAPFILFAVGRCVGWLAHALEQVQANRLIRPRARYTGPAEILNAGIY